MFSEYQRELALFKEKKSEYVWDELEELFADAFGDERLTSEEYDTLMRELMDLDCD